jgi:hypothetical protein
MPHMHGPVLAAVLVCNLVNRVYMDLYWPYAAEEGKLFYELKFPDFLDPRRFRSICRGAPMTPIVRCYVVIVR